MKKYTKTMEVEVSEAVAAGLEQAEITPDKGGTFKFTPAQLIELFELVELRAIHSWNNAPR